MPKRTIDVLMTDVMHRIWETVEGRISDALWSYVEDSVHVAPITRIGRGAKVSITKPQDHYLWRQR